MRGRKVSVLTRGDLPDRRRDRQPASEGAAEPAEVSQGGSTWLDEAQDRAMPALARAPHRTGRKRRGSTKAYAWEATVDRRQRRAEQRAHIMLEDLDRELSARVHRFVRYADACSVYVRSKRAGPRVMAGVHHFVQERLGLRVKDRKSTVDRPWTCKVLGFGFYRPKDGTRSGCTRRLSGGSRIECGRSWAAATAGAWRSASAP